jgi:hypothetical protein
MRPSAVLAALAAVLIGCTEKESSTPVDPPLALTVKCSPPRVTISNPPAVTRATDTTSSTKFTVTNNCTVPITALVFTGSRSWYAQPRQPRLARVGREQGSLPELYDRPHGRKRNGGAHERRRRGHQLVRCP